MSAPVVLEARIAAVPYKIHTVLTDNPVLSDCRGQAVEGGIQFTLGYARLRPPPRYADRPTARYMTHMVDRRCEENGIEHRLTKLRHPWTNRQGLPRRRPGSNA